MILGEKMIPYKHLSVLIMPTDYCNMNCVYCFNSQKTTKAKMSISDVTLRKIFSATIPYYDEVRYIWHGGEPTSMGIDFYRKALEMQKEINKNGTIVENSIQSNLTLLDEEFVKFFLENNINIGGSFDGTQNHMTRHNTEQILKGRELILQCGGKVGFICVVQSKNIDHLIEDYEWFKSKGINYTLNMYLTSPPYDNDELFVPAEKYIKKMCEFFDYWVSDKECNINILFFHEFIDYILFGEKSLCSYNSCLGKHIGIRFDGEIYNCNRDFPKDLCFGNINDYVDIHECFESDGFKKIVDEAYKRRKLCKSDCEIFDFCAGGCNSCSVTSGDISKPNDYFCEIIRNIYKYIDNRLSILQKENLSDMEHKVNPFHFKKLKYKANRKKSYD